MRYVYLGPDRPFGLPLKKNAILADAPEKVFPALEKPGREHPGLLRLFVPVDPASLLVRARRQLRESGSVLGITYEAIAKAGAARAEEV